MKASIGTDSVVQGSGGLGSGGVLRAAMLTAAAAVVMANLGGCLIGSSNTEASTGKEVSQATFNKIEPGVTTKKWVEATLGEPTSSSTLDDGTEVWKWSYANVKSSRGTVLFLFGGSSTKTTSGSAYVEMKDGLVTRAWRTDD